MALLNFRDVSYTWGGPQLLESINLEVNRGERIGLLGRNGAGKSTFMRILAGEIPPDNGEILKEDNVRITRLLQEVPQGITGTVATIVAEDDRKESGNPETAEHDAWRLAHAVERTLTRMSLDGTAEFQSLSSGMKRRVMLARALVREPEILLLDEPTNHLDIESISWLEKFLRGYAGTLIFVTHDRVFLQALATRIIEIDRGRLFDWTCDYATFLTRKQASLDAEDKQNQLFDRKLAEEEVWIRQGIKARRTRNEGRVRALEKMREERWQRRGQLGNVRLQAAEAERSGQLVIEAKDVCFSYDDEPVVSDFSTLITRGDKIGIIGPNGAGKTTLLKLLLGQLQPASGTIRHGTRLEIIYFDQLREQIDEEKSVVENVGEGQDMLLINGKQKHIYGYLQDFLFTPDRARQAARYLSGGERNRLLLARLFKRQSNVLVLDEPTNDLDAETLELLEELIAGYTGTLLLVSHDRAFLNNVVTSTLACDGEGVWQDYSGGYDDYLRQRKSSAAQPKESARRQQKSAMPSRNLPKSAKRTYKQQQELAALPERIAELERAQSELHAIMADPSFYKNSGEEIAAAKSRLETIERNLKSCYDRWTELDSLA